MDLPPDARAVLLNTHDGKVRAVPAQHRDLARRCAGMQYLSRARWGADESLRFDADGNETWPPTFLIDPHGRIYEGRYSGTDPLPGFDESGQTVVAGHVGGYNSGNIGIALLGDFTGALPSSAARRTLERLLTVICALGNVPPCETINYENPVNGLTAQVLGISAHSDWPTPTECPGNAFYPALDKVRTTVEARLARVPTADFAHLVELPAPSSPLRAPTVVTDRKHI